jgi:MazG family protein
MKHRHPHVFGTDRARTADSAHSLWHRAKEKEKNVRARTSVLDDLNSHFPALHRADKIGRRVARVGFDWPDVGSAVKKIEEELRELKAELRAERPRAGRISEEIGDLLFATVNVARKVKINAEIALRKTNTKFIDRFKKIEAVLKKQGKRPETATLEEMDAIWEDIKAKRKKK